MDNTVFLFFKENYFNLNLCTFICRTLDVLVLGRFLKTAQSWAYAGVFSASSAHVLGSMFVCCFISNLGDCVS